jgi:Mg-chelatase subunit ChlI
MASELQIEANRKNAKKSRGPKSVAGKMRSSRNALRHGLARTLTSQVSAPDSLESLISAYLGDSATAGAAVEIARAKTDLIRVRGVRISMLADLLKSPQGATVKKLRGLDRYERAALAKQKRALRDL